MTPRRASTPASAASTCGLLFDWLALGLDRVGHSPESIRTTASVSIEPQDGGFAIKRGHLETEASVPGIEESERASRRRGERQLSRIESRLREWRSG
jgi:organic hydroperoxide reductase OsmC/OhrA